MPLLSRGRPAWANAQPGDAPEAVDAFYETAWRAERVPSPANPVWLAVDLSSVPAAQKQQVLLHWSNDANSNYDLAVMGGPAYGLPVDYQLESNAAPGGGAPPVGGWVTHAAVNGNALHSRQHLVDLSGGATVNWLRMVVTASAGASPNDDVSFNLDVYDASAGATDSWLFLGDSITAGAMMLSSRCSPNCGTPSGSFGQLVGRLRPGFNPAGCNGGIGATVTTHALANIDAWLAGFPGRFVGLSYGTNHTGVNCQQACADAFEADMRALILRVLAAGKVPVVPTIPWSRVPQRQVDAVVLNARLALLRQQFPQALAGPDAWTFFQTNQAFISSDDLHPTEEGYFRLKKLWADTMAAPGGPYGP